MFKRSEILFKNLLVKFGRYARDETLISNDLYRTGRDCSDVSDIGTIDQKTIFLSY